MGGNNGGNGNGTRKKLEEIIQFELNEVQVCLVSLMAGKKVVELSKKEIDPVLIVKFKLDDGDEITIKRVTCIHENPETESREKVYHFNVFDQLSKLARIPLATSRVSMPL